ncbi:DUF5719 family protein [Demequina aestuarii]|uniref:DUF5719 family protein n=1 Tax=Demequina aestuarii TaxID=327095 RepID=UPI0007823819|nr:DUF5719 family protein [Demequina aestuarii]
MIRTLAIVAALLGLAAAIALDAPTPGGAPAATATFASDPRTLPAVCPGTQTIPVGDIQSGDAELDSGSDEVDFTVLPEGGEVIDGGTAFEGVGMSLERIGSGDIAGLAGMTCAPTSRDQWLVGGSTELGASARLVLSNPADTSVRAEVALHTPVGAVDGVTSVVIGPGAQRIVLLEAIEPEMPAVAVHITAGGLGVSVAIQDSRLDGFTPAGSDWVTASAVGEALAVPVPAESDGGRGATVTLIAPDGAQVDLSMVTDQGEVTWIGESALTLEPGVLTEIPVPQAAPGTVLIDASAPVAAASRVRIERDAPAGQGTQAYDFAWTGSQARADARERAVVVPPGEVSLLVHADAAGAVDFDAVGETLTVTVPASGSVIVPVDVAAGVRLSSTTEASWTLVVTDDPGFLTTIEPVSVEMSSVETTVIVGG